MASPQVVDQIRQLSEMMEQIVTVLPQEDPFQPAGEEKPAAPFLFEMKILLELLLALKESGWIIDIERPGGRIKFVRSPGKKATASFFRLSKDGTKRQITQGTRVKDPYDRPRAPDICLQDGDTGLEPTYKDVLALWDAKLRGKRETAAERRVTDAEFRSFAMIRKWLQPPLPGNDVLGEFPPAFSVCALITNGKKPTEPAAVLLDEGVSVVATYAGVQSAIWPTRQEHITAQNKKALTKKSGQKTEDSARLPSSLP